MFRHRRVLLILLILLLFLLFLKSKKKENYCLKNNLKLNEKYFQNLIYIKNLNIIYCDIPKCASTNLRRIIYGYLKQTNTYLNLNRKQIWIDNEEYFNQYYLNNNSKLILNNNNLFKFLIVRHPFQRIYSVYYDKFINNNLDDTLFGWKQLEEDILLEMKKNETLLTIRRYDIKLDLKTFLLYIINSIKNNKLINSHWEQIVYRCGFCYMNYNWIGKIEKFSSDGNILINFINKYSNIKMNSFEFPSNEIDKKDKKYILLNDYQLIQLFRNTIQNDNDFQILIDYYKPDFLLFDYTLPLI